MGIDIQLLRADQGGNPEAVRESQRRRHASVELVDEVIALDTEWRRLRGEVDQLNYECNRITEQFKIRKQANENTDDLTAQSRAKKALIPPIEAEMIRLAEARETKLNLIGNIVHDSVPVERDEKFNRVEKTWGECKNPVAEPLHHHELLHMIDGYESSRGVRIAGHRAYFLKGAGVLLNMALQNYGIAFLGSRGYMPLQPPYFMFGDVLAKTAQLSDFAESLYQVGGADDDDDEANKNRDKYLIATSEQPISALHATEWLEPQTLPRRYAGLSTCFRKEAGAHGRDTWGIFRIHQFEKVEQFVVTEPEKSWETLEQMAAVSEAFYQSLGLPYRVINIVSGALNNAAAKKYDLEAWFPSFQEFRELVSCSNCTDYQSRALEVRCGQVTQNQTAKKYVHMLNGTLCATERTICCILENYQCEEGIRIPEVLQPFMGGMTLIPFVNERPPPEKKEKEKKKAAAGTGGGEGGGAGAAPKEVGKGKGKDKKGKAADAGTA